MQNKWVCLCGILQLVIWVRFVLAKIDFVSYDYHDKSPLMGKRTLEGITANVRHHVCLLTGIRT
jgi:hypothetical protein